ncbi:MFS family permease [Geomicrobium halophilum]|uniref:MFS family permease n=1 Tax=Geomicrobium halophilum TaxID=549000 RepID=A0A841PTU2_9BACL|nr:MFS family permease [Geomicrobium halophilum]
MQVKLSKNKPYLFIISSQFIHKIAESLYDLVMPLLVLYITGSPVLMGVMYILGEVAEYLVFLFGGAIADSFNRKKLLITIAILQIIFISLIPIFEHIGILSITLLFIVAFVIDLCVCLYGIADISIIPQIVERDELPKANGIMQSVVSTSSALGPAVSGIIIAALGLFGSIWINALLFMVLLFTFRYLRDMKQTDKEEDGNVNPKTILMKSLQGIKLTFKKRLLLVLVFWQAFFIFGIHGSILMLIFYLESDIGFGSDGIGVVMTFGAIGGILSGLVFAKVQKVFKGKNGILIILGTVFAGIMFILLPFATAWYSIGVIYLGIMFSIAIVSRLISLYIQYNVESKFLGRAFAASQLISSILAPLSILIAALLAENVGTEYVFLLSGAVLLLSSVLAVLFNINNYKWIDDSTLPSKSEGS